MDMQTLLSFALAFLIFAASPGPDNLTIVSKTIIQGPLHGVAYGLGVVSSIFCFVILCAIGFSALAQVMNGNMRLIQWAGAAWLIYSGIMMWTSLPAVKNPEIELVGLLKLFATGFVLNVSNPKMPLFYMALLPGLVGTAPLSVNDVAALLVVIAGVEVLVIGGHVLAATRARKVLSEPRTIRKLNRGAGSLMVGAGLLVATR